MAVVNQMTCAMASDATATPMLPVVSNLSTSWKGRVSISSDILSVWFVLNMGKMGNQLRNAHALMEAKGCSMAVSLAACWGTDLLAARGAVKE